MIELVIYVPSNFDDYNLKSEVSSIGLSDLSGNVKAKTKTGAIKVKNYQYVGKCELLTNTGEINIDLKDSNENDYQLICKTNVGRINCNVEKGISTLIETNLSTLVENINLNFNGDNVDYSENYSKALRCIINGVCKLSANTQVGKLEVTK